MKTSNLALLLAIFVALAIAVTVKVSQANDSIGKIMLVPQPARLELRCMAYCTILIWGVVPELFV